MQYRGSCYCGKVAFEVDGELTGVMARNCFASMSLLASD